jgi:3-oxoacyl-[acyl-carrier-protein] synthase I
VNSPAVHISAASGACALGTNLHSIREALLAGRSGIRTEHRYSDFVSSPAGELDWSAFGNFVDGPFGSDQRILAATEAVTDQACAESRLLERYAASKIVVIAASTTSGIDSFFDAARSINQDPKPLPSVLPLMQQHCLAARLQSRFGFGYSHTVSSSCAASSQSLRLAALLLGQGAFDAAVVVGADILNLLTLRGFAGLQILDQNLCRPFADDRSGINLGEAVVAVVLEADRQDPYASMGKLCGSYSLSESWQMTLPEPTGRYMARCMSGALADASIRPDDLDCINPHGTGTIHNDGAELIAIRNVFGPDSIPSNRFFPTKSLTGHTLGACGILEMLFTLFRTKETGISNSFGFGGVFASLVVRPAPQ